MSKKNLLFLLALFGSVLILRLASQGSNFSPLLALVVVLGTRKSFLDGLIATCTSPLLTVTAIWTAFFISDLTYLGLDSSMITVYLTIWALYGFGLQQKSANSKIWPYLFRGTISALIFFVLTNFHVWIFSGLYSRDVGGLVDCYIAAIPFFRATLVSTIFFLFCLEWAFNLAEMFSRKWLSDDT